MNITFSGIRVEDPLTLVARRGEEFNGIPMFHQMSEYELEDERLFRFTLDGPEKDIYQDLYAGSPSLGGIDYIELRLKEGRARGLPEILLRKQGYHDGGGFQKANYKTPSLSQFRLLLRFLKEPSVKENRHLQSFAAKAILHTLASRLALLQGQYLRSGTEEGKQSYQNNVVLDAALGLLERFNGQLTMMRDNS